MEGQNRRISVSIGKKINMESCGGNRYESTDIHFSLSEDLEPDQTPDDKARLLWEIVSSWVNAQEKAIRGNK